MATPKSFADDGAAGASGTPGGNAATANLGTGGTPASWEASLPASSQSYLQNYQTPGASEVGGSLGDQMLGQSYTVSPTGEKEGVGAQYGEDLGGGYSPSTGLPTMAFSAGGSMPDDGSSDDNDDGSTYQPDDSSQGQPAPQDADRMSLALASVDSGLSYGRQKNGLPTDMDDGSDGQQQAANMPMRPGNPSDSGVPPLQPSPGPLPPTNNPFGKRDQYSANMPMSPPSQSESGIKPLQPAPGKLPPTSNPFGKRADNEPDDGSDGGDSSGYTPDSGEDDEGTA